MKIRYKITIIAICAYFGVFLGPVTASNVYCDFIAQEMCTSRITGVDLPPFNMVPLGQASDNECFFGNVQDVLVPCNMGHFEWPFPPHDVEHFVHCEEICNDETVQRQGAEILLMRSAIYGTHHLLVPKVATVVLGVNNTVYWHNLDETVRTLVADYGGWDTGRMLPGETASVTFNQTGVYEYHGMPGPWITGTIIVIDEQSFDRSGHDPLRSVREEFQAVEYMSIIEQEDILIFFASRLMSLGIDWEMPDRVWINNDFLVQPPARICSNITVYDTDLYISTVWQDEYSHSDMVIHKDVPDDCVKMLPVSEIGR